MAKGVALGVGAGLLWGLAFVLPELAQGWSAVAIATGRYLIYGAASVAILVATARRFSGAFFLVRRHWRSALLFAATGNVGYYLLLVTAIHAIGAAPSAVIIGSIPVVLATVSNIRHRSYAWRQLLVPLILVATGLTVVSAPDVLTSQGTAATTIIIGIAAAVAAVALWTIYGVANAEFLSANPSVGGSSWAAVIGIFTGALALVLLPVALIQDVWDGPDAPMPSDIGLLLGVSVVLGLVVSWGATWLWNETSARIPTTLAGLLITVETVAGYTYAYLLESRLPTPLELSGFAAVIIGVVIVARLTPNRVPARSRSAS